MAHLRELELDLGARKRRSGLGSDHLLDIPRPFAVMMPGSYLDMQATSLSESKNQDAARGIIARLAKLKGELERRPGKTYR